MCLRPIIHFDYYNLGFFYSENEKIASSEGESIPKPKKFFKSRNTDPPDLSSSYKATADMTYGNVTKKIKIVSEPSEKTPGKGVGRKFFSSKGNSPEKTVLSSNVNNSKRNETKPPIVLRICRGKSQLVSDSDESESTPTPSSTPSTSNTTSPRALRDTAQRSPNCRITRSARRSMQQDPSSSPATADTPTEFSLFTSPKQDIDLSPQYIPAEKYELERKAMYDNLLKPNSPSFLLDDKVSTEESRIDDITDKTVEETHTIEDPMEKFEESVEPEVKEPEPMEETKPPPLPEEPITKGSIEEEWDTDSDSNSTTADSESKPNPTEDSEPLPAHVEEEEDEEQKEKPEENAPETAPPVKLVISKKKGSIFKSRPLVTDVTKKRRALYRHKWSDDKDAPQKSNDTANTNNTSSSVYDEFGFNDDPLTRVKVAGSGDGDSEGVTSIKCTKSDKGVRFFIFFFFNFILGFSFTQLYET